jgi:hypothetical protein
MQAAVNLFGKDLQEEVVIPPILDRSAHAIEGNGVVDLLSGSRWVSHGDWRRQNKT